LLMLFGCLFLFFYIVGAVTDLKMFFFTKMSRQ
jgi:hypothetical protein